MTDVAVGSIEFGVFVVLSLVVFLTGRDRGPAPEEIEMGSGRPADAGQATATGRLAA